MEAWQQKNKDVAVAALSEANSFMAEDDDLLNFNLDDGEENKNIVGSNNIIISKGPSFSSSIPLLSHRPDDLCRSPSFPEFVEEELEWLSNKDAFPSVETCFDLLPENPDMEGLNNQSPVSVLENRSSSSNSNGNSSGNGSTIMSCSGILQVPTNFPVRARSKRSMRRRTGFGEFSCPHLLWFKQVNKKSNRRGIVPVKMSSGSKIGRRCLHCQADQTPQWRTGPLGPKTLCNACGVRYKSGRLVPEYRPASSPTFSATLHSNSHRRIIEMRMQKQLPTGRYIGNDNKPKNGERGLWI